MEANDFALAKKICMDMGIEWDDGAEYAKIDGILLKDYLSQTSIFDDEDKYSQITLKQYGDSVPIYEHIETNGYDFAA